MELEDLTVAQLLEKLHVTSAFGVETGRVSNSLGTTNTDLRRLLKEAEELGRHPKYFAQSGGGSRLITREQMEALRAAGAPDENIKVLRSAKTEGGGSYSDKCPSCYRWINLGHYEHEATCVCGKTYRVVFDRGLNNEILMQRTFCMDCGQEQDLSQARSGLNPWHSGGNAYQVQCDACSRKAK